MGLFDTPQMPLAEFRHRVEWFTHEPPLTVDGEKYEGATGFAEAAREILDRTETWDWVETVDPEWWNLSCDGLSNAAIRLGMWIICGSSYREEKQLNIDLTEMPEVYRRPFQEFVQEMVDVMVAGVGKGYTIADNYENGIGWQCAEGRMKYKEFMHLFADDQIDRAGRVIIKPATAAFVTWAAFIWYNDEFQNWRSERDLC